MDGLSSEKRVMQRKHHVHERPGVDTCIPRRSSIKSGTY